jgi:dinuclear metal center YbgI/SA1388 family protein
VNHTVRDIMNAMERWAPAQYAYAWDKSGLAVGAPDAPVARVLACLTVTREALDAARRAKAEMLVSHHPLIWEPLKSLRTDSPHTRLCLDVAQAGIAAFSAHTNLDVVPDGVNAVLATKIGLVDTRPLFPLELTPFLKLVCFVPDSHLAPLRTAVSEAGAGCIGAYSHCSFSAPGIGTFLPGDATHPYSGKRGQLSEEPERRFETIVPKSALHRVLDALHRVHPYEEPAYDLLPLENRDPRLGLGMRGKLPKPMRFDAFANLVREALGCEAVRRVGPPKRRVSAVAVLGGAGGSEIAKLPPDLDAYVTGDVKYHDAHEAMLRGIGVVDAGHRGTEHFIVPEIAAHLRAELAGLRVSEYNEPELFSTVAG